MFILHHILLSSSQKHYVYPVGEYEVWLLYVIQNILNKFLQLERIWLWNT